MSVAPTQPLSLTIQRATRATPVPRAALLRRAAQAASQRPGEVTLRVVGEAEGRRLNRDYRGKDYATNVLSFAYDDAPAVCGDLVLCAPVLQREAAEQGKSLEAHYAHLVVHGLLHLQGYDHEDEDDAVRMEQIERRIVMELGYSDPYPGEPV